MTDRDRKILFAGGVLENVETAMKALHSVIDSTAFPFMEAKIDRLARIEDDLSDAYHDLEDDIAKYCMSNGS